MIRGKEGISGVAFEGALGAWHGRDGYGMIRYPNRSLVAQS